MINRNRYDHRKGAHRAVWIREDMTAEHGGYDIAIVYVFSILIHNECSWENLRELCEVIMEYVNVYFKILTLWVQISWVGKCKYRLESACFGYV